MTKALCLILLASRASALLAQGPSACGTNLNQLVVGSDFGGTLGYEPFEQEVKGEVQGFDALVACNVAQRLGFQSVTFLQIAFDGLLADLTASPSPIDIVISAMSITPGRVDLPNVSFVKYNEDSLGIVLNVADVTPALQNPVTVLTALNALGSPTDPLIIATTEGSREQTILLDNAYPNLSPLAEVTLDEALSDLTSGKAFALFVDGPTAVALAAANPDTLFALKDVIDTTNSDPSQGLGIAINSECCQLYANIQQAINDMNADGTLARLRTQFNVQQGFTPVSGLAPACAGTPTINSNSIANYLFSKYCTCEVTVAA